MHTLEVTPRKISLRKSAAFHFKKSALVLSLGLAIGIGFSPLAKAYDSFTDLGHGAAFGINDLGQVVGQSSKSLSIAQATLWNGTTPTSLGVLSGNTYATGGINNSEQVAGYSLTSTGSQATLWNGTNPSALSGLGGAYSQATAINNAGQVVGFSNPTDNASYQAVLWNGATPTVLGGLGGTYNMALAINISGQVVGSSLTTGNASQKAVLWNGTTPTILGGLGGTTSFAGGINDAGQIVGGSFNAGNASLQATLWNSTTPTALGGLGGTRSGASGINKSGQIVGYSYTTGNAGYHATMWTMKNGTMVLTDLNTLIDPALGFTLTDATAINNNGQIVGYGTNSLGVQDAFVLNTVAAVPEPSEWLLMLTGFGLTGLFAVRRRKSAV